MPNSNELAKIRQNLADWLRAFNAKDVDQMFELYDEESIYANANAPLMRGIDEIKPWYAAVLGKVTGTLLHKEEQAFVDENLALLIGAYYFKPPVGEAPDMTGRVALAYRRNERGEWKLLFDMDNTPPDVTPDLFT